MISQKTVTATPGTQVLAFSNLYGVAVGDEPFSVQRGVVSTVTNLERVAAVTTLSTTARSTSLMQ